MEITEVRIKLIEDGGERLHAFCSITFDDSFVIRDLKIIEGTHGPFVAMPSRHLTVHCPNCCMTNHLRSSYCNQCGARQKDERPAKDEDGRTKLYADIAHPINSTCREMIQDRVIREYQAELKRSKLPGYVSRYDDIDGDVSPSVPHPAVSQAGHCACLHRTCGSLARPACPAVRRAHPAAASPPAAHADAAYSGCAHVAARPHVPARTRGRGPRTEAAHSLVAPRCSAHARGRGFPQRHASSADERSLVRSYLGPTDSARPASLNRKPGLPATTGRFRPLG